MFFNRGGDVVNDEREQCIRLHIVLYRTVILVETMQIQYVSKNFEFGNACALVGACPLPCRPRVIVGTLPSSQSSATRASTPSWYRRACERRFGRFSGPFPPGVAHRLRLIAPTAAIE